MAMKETEGSLRAYFLLAGVISILLSIRDLGAATEIPFSALPTDWMMAIYVPLITRLGLGAAYLVAGIFLKTALPTGAGWIKHILVLGMVLMTANAVLIAVVLGSDEGSSGLIGAIIGVAITVYLYKSVTRLSAEAVTRAATPPAARVV
ncbi:MAG: hypothetical protein H0T42_06925 [Deltaproteobacteria bacterium]|nr:hypothetical protein [Deltaproteobacteria bacterium]